MRTPELTAVETAAATELKPAGLEEELDEATPEGGTVAKSWGLKNLARAGTADLQEFRVGSFLSVRPRSTMFS